MTRTAWKRLRIALALILIFAGLTPIIRPPIQIAMLEHEFKRRWDIQVIHAYLTHDIGPIFSEPDRRVTLSDAPKRQALSALRQVRIALSIYPDAFVKTMLHRIVLADDLKMWGKHADGIFFSHTIVVDVGVVDYDRGDDIIRGVVHHELSSIVRQSVLFNATLWTAHNPPGFHYIEEHIKPQDVNITTSPTGDDVIHESGFVNAYGETTLDNDWNTYAQEIFNHGKEFAALIKRFPVMRWKARTVMDTYLDAAPSLVKYFRETGLQEVTAEVKPWD